MYQKAVMVRIEIVPKYYKLVEEKINYIEKFLCFI